MPVPKLMGTTATNWLVANWSGEGMIAENPENPSNIVSGSLYEPPNDSVTYYTSGVIGAYYSNDGGHSWVVQMLPPDPAWSNKSSPLCGMIHWGDSAIGFGPNNTVYYVDLSYYAAGSYYGCSGSGGGLGVYSTVSTDGGVAWGKPVSLRGTNNVTLDKPWIAVDQVTGEAYVAYTDAGVNGSQIRIQNSTDRGKTWSEPLNLSGGPEDTGVELAVDPWGGLSATWVGSGIMFARSTDHGHTFTKPKIIATVNAYFANPSPDAFRAFMLPGLTVDSYAKSPYAGRLFSVWQNGIGWVAGSPNITLTYSSDNGSTWAAPIKINSDSSYEDFQPDVAVAPDGTVYVEWYAENSTNGHYNLLGAVSHSGGAKFDTEIRISDNDSFPNYATAGNVRWIGDYTDMIADSLGARPLWTDARANQSSTCSPCRLSYDYNISLYTAMMVNATLTSNVPVNITVNGTVRPSGIWSIGSPNTYGDWLAGQTYSLTAPSTAAWNGTQYYFVAWFGASFTTSRQINGTVSGRFQWHACYSPNPTGTCQAAGAPGFLGVNATPTSASLRLDGAPAVLSNGTGSFMLAPGPHWVNLSAPGYRPFRHSYLVTSGNLTEVNAQLSAYPGLIEGTISPTTANVTIDGQGVSVAPNGTFSRVVPIGTHSVAANQYGYSTYQNDSVFITPNSTASLKILLTPGEGIIRGAVTPTNASVTINGVGVAVSGGAFSVSRAPGTYWVNATLPGYLAASSGPFTLAPLAIQSVHLTLVRPTGHLVGTVAPPNAEVSIGAAPIPVSLGTFDTILIVGSYLVNATAPGFIPASYVVTIAQGAITPLSIVLEVAPGWITGVVFPAVARVTVDGLSVTVLPDGSFNTTVNAGSHRVDASAAGYDSNSSIVRVHGGQALQLSIILHPSPAAPNAFPLSLVMGIVAIMAAIAAVVIIVRRRRRSAPPLEPTSG